MDSMSDDGLEDSRKDHSHQMFTSNPDGPDDILVLTVCSDKFVAELESSPGYKLLRPKRCGKFIRTAIRIKCFKLSVERERERDPIRGLSDSHEFMCHKRVIGLFVK